MRLKICLGLVGLALGGCANLSGYVRLDLGPAPAPAAPAVVVVTAPAPPPAPADAPKW